MDCTDIKVIASGFVDAELDADTRHAAERHLVECAACRSLVDQLESLSDRIISDAAGTGEGLPDGFAGAVLARTVYAEAPARRIAGWTSWLGWIAAAAALVLAVFVWQLDQTPLVVTPTPAVAESGARATDPYGGARLATLRSWVHDGPTRPSDDPLELEGDPEDVLLAAPLRSEISREDAVLLESTALFLEILAVRHEDSATDVDRLREIAIYEDLLPRLRNAWRRLDPSDRKIVSAAESVLDRITNGPSTAENVQDLRDTVDALDLPGELEKLSARGGADTWM